MIGDISKAEHIYIAVGYTDMRKQIDGLSAIVQQNFKLDPFSNSVFLFCGRNTRTMKASDGCLKDSLSYSPKPFRKVIHKLYCKALISQEDMPVYGIIDV